MVNDTSIADITDVPSPKLLSPIVYMRKYCNGENSQSEYSDRLHIFSLPPPV